MELCDLCDAPATDCIGGTHYHCGDPECIRVVTIDELVWSGRMAPGDGDYLVSAGLSWNGA